MGLGEMIEYIRVLEDALHMVDCPPEFVPTQDEQGGCVYCAASGRGGGIAHPSEKDHDEDCAWLMAHRVLEGVFCPNCGVRKGQVHGVGIYFDIRSNQAKAVGCRPGDHYK